MSRLSAERLAYGCLALLLLAMALAGALTVWWLAMVWAG